MFLLLHDLLHLSRFCANSYKTDYQRFARINTDGKNCAFTDLFLLKNIRLQKSHTSFFFRSYRLEINLPRDINFTDPIGLKQRLMKKMLDKLKRNYDENIKCSWKLSSDCSKTASKKDYWKQKQWELSPNHSHNSSNNNNSNKKQ